VLGEDIETRRQRPAALRKLGLALATTFGAGYVPGAPGTAGSAVGAGIAFLLHWLGGFWAVAIGTALLLPIAIWAANVAEEHYGEHDSCHIVIDEVVGQLIALLPTRCDPVSLMLGFGFFRLFDSLKPWPAGRIDRESRSGAGVVLDDVAAGVQGALVMGALVLSGVIPWLAHRLHLPY